MAQLSIRLLGGFDIACGDAPVTDLATDKVRALLAYLAVESEHPQRRDLLADLLWPEMPADRARHNLRQTLSRLRTALDHVGHGDLLLTEGHDLVRLHVADDVWIDVIEAKELITACHRHRHRRADGCLPCLQRYRRLIELYRDDFLAHFHVADGQGFEEWALIQREWLRRHVMQALAITGAYHERRGERREAQQLAWRQVTLEPWREEAHRDLMRLLASAGERNAALAQYEACRRSLMSELQVEPTAETVQLARDIRTGAWEAGREPPLPPLPLPGTRFIGREDELTHLAEILASADGRLVTLTGPGGIGKTRLALELADRHRGLYADGVAFVACEALDDCTAVMPAIVEALRLETTAERAPEPVLRDALRHRELLLVLDNLERVLGCAPALARLLQAAPQLTVLSTSHERLRLREERVHAVEGLSFPEMPDSPCPERYDAVALFLERARRLDHTFGLTPATTPDVVAICRLVQGASLAVELAAYAAVDHGCAAVRSALGESLDALTPPFQDALDRHRSLRAVCDYAWNALPPDDPTTLAALAAFAGGFTIEAAKAVAGTSPAALAGWAGRSLLRQEQADRFTWHPVMRRYAAERLAADPAEEARVRERHARYVAAWLADQTAHIRDATQQTALAAIARDLENVRAAWRWAVARGEDAVAAQMLHGLYHFHRIRGRFEEGRSLLSFAIDRWAAQESPPPVALVGQIHARHAALAILLGCHEEAREALQDALNLARQLDAGAEIRFCLLQLSRLMHGEERALGVDQIAEEVLQLARRDNDAGDAARALFLLGQQRYRAGDPEGAAARYADSLAHADAAGDPRLSLIPLNALGDIACHRGDYAAARDTFERCLNLSQALGDRFLAAIHLNNLGTAYHLQGLTREAEGHYQESLRLCREIGDRAGEAIALSNLGEVATQHDNPIEAERAFAAALAIGRALGDEATVALCLSNLGDIAVTRGHLDRARTYFAEALEISSVGQDWAQATKTLLGAADLLARTDQRPLAAAVLTLLSCHPAAEQQVRDTAARRHADLRTGSSSPLTSLEDAIHAVRTVLSGG